MSVIGATRAVLARGAAELRHRDQHGIFREISKIIPECTDRLRELAKQICELALSIALVYVMVPPADVCEGYFNAEVGLQQLRYLSEAVAEAAPGIVRSWCWSVARRIGGFKHLHGLERFLPGAVKYGVHRLRVHCFKGVADRRCIRIASANAKVVDVAERDRRKLSGEGARQRCTQGHCPKRGMLLRVQRLHGAIEPAIFSGFQPRRA